MLVASILSAEMRLESTRCVVPRTALPAPLQRVSASGLQCLVIASGERSCASVRKEFVNVVVREAEGRDVICVIVDDGEKPLASLAHETKPYFVCLSFSLRAATAPCVPASTR